MVQETEYLETFDGDIIEKDDVIDDLKSKYDNAYYNNLTKITDFEVGSEAYHILDTIASLYLDAREEINDNYLMSMVHTQEGEFLDNTGDEIGVYRKDAASSSGYIIIYYNDVPLTASQIIDEGLGEVCDLVGKIYLNDLTVLTDDSISFIVEDNDNVLNGERYVILKATCEYDGEYTNVLQDTITIIEGDFPAKVRVTNLPFTEGRDIESDDEYRNRILESPSNHPTGSINWYKEVPFIEGGVSELVHDIVPTKQGLAVNEDLRILYNPIDKSETPQTYSNGQSSISGTYTPSEYALRQFFSLDEYNIVGVNLGYNKALIQYVLADTTSEEYDIEYVIYCNLNTNEYPDATVESITPKVESILEQFNLDANIGEAFNPQTLCVLIEDLPEVIDAIIYQKASKNETINWGVVSEEISMDYDEVYQVSPDVTVITEGPSSGLIVTPTKSDDP